MLKQTLRLLGLVHGYLAQIRHYQLLLTVLNELTDV